MKKTIRAGIWSSALVSIIFIFSSCLKDKCSRTYTLSTPEYSTLTQLRLMVQSKPAAEIVSAGKLFIKDNWIFLNEKNKGIHVIDNSNPAHPIKASFINIPGNADMYIKGNTLYADLYSDLLAADISNPKHITVQKYLNKTFPARAVGTSSSNPDSIRVITGWISRDTVVDCSTDRTCINCGIYYSGNPQSLAYSSISSSTAGIAGSMARFAAVNNYMYAVTTSELNVIDITNTANPLFVQKKSIGWDIETIFPYNNKLYVGAGSSMSVYDLSDPINPAQLSWNGHWCSHDPVVVDENYAYVTLHEATVCNGKVNQLELYDLSSPNAPRLVKVYPLVGPQGLAKDGNLLFVCDDGLKIYDAVNPMDLKLVKALPGFKTFDVIASNGIAYLVTDGGLFQYSYQDIKNVTLLSKLK